jgi:aspartyl-tRNA(Asn)/glutamyl-tRNA(Gln) amidotransferase subunit A
MAARLESELAFLSIEQASRLLRRREISPVELVDIALARIDRLNPAVNAFLTILADSASRRAKAAEREIGRGRSRGPLHGIPVSLKDNFWTRGVRTTAGSRILAGFIPKEDSDVAASLARAGAILLGKTNMHEFAYGITSENAHYGPVHNPWALERVSGGSSGGSAAAVAIGMGLASMGTDTGGSIRIPAALCGVVGLKPTFGLVSAKGSIPLGISFDHPGPLARGVVDACILLEAVAGKYPRAWPRPDHRKLGRKPSRCFRIAWPKHFYFERLDSEVRRLVEASAKLVESLPGCRVREVALPRLPGAIDLATNLVLSEANHYHESQGYYPARSAEYGDDVRAHLKWGHEIRAVDYLRGAEARKDIQADFAAAFEHVDAILAPTSPIPAPRIGASSIRIAGQRETPVRAELLRMTRPANITGLPAISIPCGFTCAGLPVGLQLIGPHWSEARLLSIAFAFEQATEWHKRHPDLG